MPAWCDAPLNIGLATTYHRAKNDKHGGRSWERQRPLRKPHDDDVSDHQVRVAYTLYTASIG